MNWWQSELLAVVLQVVLLFPAMYVEAVLHETGHYIAAKSLGLITRHVEIGRGDLWFKFTLFNDNWYFLRHVGSARVVARPSSRWWKNMIMSVAGLLVSFLVLFACVWFGLYVFAFAFAVDFVDNTIPQRGNDGYMARYFWRQRLTQLSPKYRMTDDR